MMRWALMLVLAVAMAAPADARYSLRRSGEVVKVGNAGLRVQPDGDWNRLGTKVGRYAESWTLDGQSLNDLTFYAGIKNDKTLFREVDRRDRPLPRFRSDMLAPEIVQLFENSYRVAAGTSLFSLGKVEPAVFAGSPGVRFTYSFTIQGEEVRRNGEAIGAVIGGRLYLIAFEAPAIHFFDRDIARARALMASATIAS